MAWPARRLNAGSLSPNLTQYKFLCHLRWGQFLDSLLVMCIVHHCSSSYLSWKSKPVQGERDDQRDCSSCGILIGLLGLLGLLADAAADTAWGDNPWESGRSWAAYVSVLWRPVVCTNSCSKLIQVCQVRINLSNHCLHSDRFLPLVWLSCSNSFRPLNEYGRELWTCCGKATVLDSLVPRHLAGQKKAVLLLYHC